MVIPKIALAGEEKILGDCKGIKGNLLDIATAVMEPKSQGNGVYKKENTIAPTYPINSATITGKKP